MTTLHSIQGGIQSVMEKLLASTDVYRRKNPAARAERTTVMPDLAAEGEPLDILAAVPLPVEVGEGETVLVLVPVPLDGLAGPEP